MGNILRKQRDEVQTQVIEQPAEHPTEQLAEKPKIVKVYSPPIMPEVNKKIDWNLLEKT